LAGLSYSLSLLKKGISLTVGGYTQRVSDLVQLVAKNLTVVKIDEQKFNNLKEAMLRALRNQKLATAISRGGYYNRLLWLKKHYDEDQLIAALEPVTLADVQAYAKKLYERVYITAVAHGNWRDKNVKETVQLLLDEIKSKPFPEEERFVQKLEWLDDGENIRFSKKVQDTNNSISYGLQIGHYEYPLQAKLLMMSSIVEPDFYLQMRTNQQLGYIVWSFNQRVEDDLFFKFVIQSGTYSPFELQKRIDKWLASSIGLFEKLSDKEFERHRESLIVSLEKKGDSIAEMLDDYYYLATREKGNFDHKKELIEAVKQIKKEDVIAAARKFFMDKKTPRLLVLMRSKDNNEPVPSGVIAEVASFKNRKKK
ncbi:MAG: insulinase family protein, partial [Nitrospinales bacterium]